MAIHAFGNLLISLTNGLLIATFTFVQINNILKRKIVDGINISFDGILKVNSSRFL